MKKLNVLQIINRPSITGGMELYAFNLSRELRKSGHAVTMALRPETEFYEAARSENFDIIPITRGGALQPYNIFSIFKFMLGGRCDILHAHTGNDYWPPLLAKWLAFSKKSRVFVTRHILSAPRGFSSKFYFQHVDTVCVSNAVYQVMRDFSAKGSRLKLIYPGINAGDFLTPANGPFYREKFGISSSEYVIAAMHKWFEKSFPIISKILEEFRDIKVIMAGELKKHEIAAIEASPFRERIHICGVIKNMADFYKSADLFLFPSFDEAFGLVVVEALAAGLPVLTAASGGASEIFEDGSCGFKIPVEDITGYCEAVNRIKSDRAFAEKLSGNASAAAVNFNISKMTLEIEAAYYESLGRKD